MRSLRRRIGSSFYSYLEFSQRAPGAQLTRKRLTF